MKDYSINLRTLVENHKTNTALGGSPALKAKELNSTQIQMAEITDRIRRFAEDFYTPDELKKAYPIKNRNSSITKIHNEILSNLAPTAEEVFNV